EDDELRGCGEVAVDPRLGLAGVVAPGPARGGRRLLSPDGGHGFSRRRVKQEGSRFQAREYSWQLTIEGAPYSVRRPVHRPAACAPSRPREAAPGIVVGVGILLRGALVFRHVAEVDADARPHRRAAAHRVDEDVLDGEVGGRGGVAGLPALEPGEGVVLLLRLGDRDERLGRALLLAGGLDPRGLAGLLLVVRRPGGVAEPL